MAWVHHAVLLVDTWQVDLADKFDGGRRIGVLVTAVHLDGVNSVLVYTLQYARLVPKLYWRVKGIATNVRRSQDRAIPVRHQEIFWVI